ncbi:hypothetical protein BDR26DRAFT_867583 [Obelidium mucronatum]|nr:hypothetical protein BDR26DRAFT_867583 [Obelidium mucronatum]
MLSSRWVLAVYAGILLLIPRSHIQVTGLRMCPPKLFLTMPSIQKARCYSHQTPIPEALSTLSDYSLDRVAFQNGTTFWSMKGCGPSAVINFHDTNTFLVTCYDDNSILQVSLEGKTLARVNTTETIGEGFLGPNDFALDCFGGVYFTASGVWDVSAPAEGAVYYIPKPMVGAVLLSGSDVYKVVGGIHYANGIAVIKQGQVLLVSATLENAIHQFSIAKNKKNGRMMLLNGVKEKKIYSDLNAAAPQLDLVGGYMGPDGMREADGIVYVAQFGGGRVLKFKENGQLFGSINFEGPFRNNTNVWIQGTTLYTTQLTEVDLPTGNLYPGVVVKVDDTQLKSRENLLCVIV